MRADLVESARQLLEALRKQGLTLVTAESCTGGLISAYLTEIPGASDVVERGLMTYSNAAKRELLGVPCTMIETHGAVSEEVAGAMAIGALANSPADICVAVTGVAGPGGSEDKPAGLVFVAAKRREAPIVHIQCNFGDIGRGEVRASTVAEAFRLVRSLI